MKMLEEKKPTNLLDGIKIGLQLLASQASAADRPSQAVSSQANLVTSETPSPIPTTSDSTSQQEGVRLQELQTNLDTVQQVCRFFLFQHFHKRCAGAGIFFL